MSRPDQDRLDPKVGYRLETQAFYDLQSEFDLHKFDPTQNIGLIALAPNTFLFLNLIHADEPSHTLYDRLQKAAEGLGEFTSRLARAHGTQVETMRWISRTVEWRPFNDDSIVLPMLKGFSANSASTLYTPPWV